MRDEALDVLKRPGPWLWGALVVGAALRVWLVFFTEGSFDVLIKLQHGTQIRELGLLEYYRQAPVMNHPPLMGAYFAACAALADATGVAFGTFFRAPFALLDLLTAGLLMRCFADSPLRWAVFAACWLNPLVILFSAYHGNTDPAVPCFVLFSVLAAARERPVLAGVAVGLGLWIKLPVLVAAPAVFFALQGRRARVRLVATTGVVAVLGYLPLLVVEPGLLLERIFGYPGSGVVTGRGVAIWGAAYTLRFAGSRAAELMAAANSFVVWTPILLLAWLRRGRRDSRSLGATVCGSYLILYAVTSYWAWQYLAWSAPLWLFLGWRFTAVATLVVGGYVYGVYALFTGSPWLVGRWDSVRHPTWPRLLTWLRDASVLLCLGTSAWLLARAARDARRPEEVAAP